LGRAHSSPDPHQPAPVRQLAHLCRALPELHGLAAAASSWRACQGAAAPEPYKATPPKASRALTPSAAFAPRRLVAVQRRRAAIPKPSTAGRRFDLPMWSTVGTSRDRQEFSRAALEPPHRFSSPGMHRSAAITMRTGRLQAPRRPTSPSKSGRSRTSPSMVSTSLSFPRSPLFVLHLNRTPRPPECLSFKAPASHSNHQELEPPLYAPSWIGPRWKKTGHFAIRSLCSRIIFLSSFVSCIFCGKPPIEIPLSHIKPT
jgi:hypothetical protein